jgi:hypothetical protein
MVAETHDISGLATATFDEFSIGAVTRATGNVIFPLDGYIGMVVVGPRAISGM